VLLEKQRKRSTSGRPRDEVKIEFKEGKVCSTELETFEILKFLTLKLKVSLNLLNFAETQNLKL